MTVDNDPLFGDICSMIRAKIALNSTLTGILGSDPLRIYRYHPPINSVYPLGVIVKAGTDNESFRYVGNNFSINIIFHYKDSNKSDLDVIERGLQDIFGERGGDFNYENTKIEQVYYNGSISEFYDPTFKTWIMPINLSILARRKSHIA